MVSSLQQGHRDHILQRGRLPPGQRRFFHHDSPRHPGNSIGIYGLFSLIHLRLCPGLWTGILSLRGAFVLFWRLCGLFYDPSGIFLQGQKGDL